MSDPRLLREGTPRMFDRALLESAREDRAPDGSEERALAALGIGALAVTGAAVVASQGASAPPAAAAASKIATAVLLKWLGVGLAVTVATAAPVTYLVVSNARSSDAAAAAPATSADGQGRADRGPPRAPSIAPAATERDETPAAPEPSAAPPDVSAEMPVTAAPPPAVRSAPVPAAPRASSTTAQGAAPSPARSASSLSPELDVLDRARNALAARDPAGARTALDEYQRRFPNGSLREEAELASIETLVLGGDTAGAHQAAVRFLEAHPGSAYGGRVRAIVKRTSNP